MCSCCTNSVKLNQFHGRSTWRRPRRLTGTCSRYFRIWRSARITPQGTQTSRAGCSVCVCAYRGQVHSDPILQVCPARTNSKGFGHEAARSQRNSPLLHLFLGETCQLVAQIVQIHAVLRMYKTRSQSGTTLSRFVPQTPARTHTHAHIHARTHTFVFTCPQLSSQLLTLCQDGQHTTHPFIQTHVHTRPISVSTHGFGALRAFQEVRAVFCRP